VVAEAGDVVTSGIQIERPLGQRCTLVAISDDYFISQGAPVPSSPVVAFPAGLLSNTVIAAADFYKSETRPAHIWAAESKRKLMLKKFPFLRYTK
jgi:hypothetical protein